MIGLLMIKDETDMLAEALRNHTVFCDAIYVLDGTNGPLRAESEAICRSFPEVKGYFRDADIGIELPLRDGARGFLLEHARAEQGFGHWYAVLHGDEIWAQDPRDLASGHPDVAKAYSVKLFHFFPHISQRDSWDYVPYETSIEACATHFMLPGITEHRLFFDTGKHDFDIDRHSRVIPLSIDTFHTDLVVKQYNYRTPRQAHTRATTRRDDLWQQNHYQHLLDGTDNFFVNTLVNDMEKWAGSVPVGEGIATNTSAMPLPYLRPLRSEPPNAEQRNNLLSTTQLISAIKRFVANLRC